VFDLRKFLAIILGKAGFLFLKGVNRGATAAPGLLALKIDPRLLVKLKKNLKFSLIVSGTNGKTTTARMLASLFKASQIPFFHNRTGSNLLRGITSALIKHCRLNGALAKRIGLWEVDEAVFPEAVKQLQPKIIVLTNLFRDQLDRYGEIDTLAKKWQQALKKLPQQTIVILNSDDPMVASLGKTTANQVIYYGLKDKSLGTKELSHASDATLCPRCLLPLQYDCCFVSHLGLYRCPKCGQIQPQTHFACSQAKLKPEDLRLKINQEKIQVKLSGIYNIYNVLASLAAAKALGLSSQSISQGYQNFKPAFGRFEEIKFDNKNLKILLVKNPTGFNQVLKTLIQLTKEKKIALLIALNDLIADGRDVSWIWDVDMALLSQIKIDKIFVSGRRYLDMALRIKHANIKNKILKIKNLSEAVPTLINRRNKNLFILPTYTAMLATRKILNKMGLVHRTWED
jgi:UDP-N-acetylmuramyl tripeptide synthase